MAVTPPMAMIGSVSGGCVESAVLDEAIETLKDNSPRLLHYGISDDTAWGVGLACGGRVSVYVEPLDQLWWRAALDSVQHNRAALSVTVISGPQTGQKLLYGQDRGVVYQSSGLDAPQGVALAKIAAEAFPTQRKTNQQTVGDQILLIDPIRPSPRLVIIGGAHVSQALCRLAEVLGFGVVVIDPRGAFATTERFPAVQSISHQYPDVVLPTLDLDSETYVAVLTHDPKIDDPALQTVLSSPVAYIGVMSSKRSHQLRLDRLTKAGIDSALFARIHTPIGLDVGAQTPEEIALSIMAQIISVRNGKIPTAPVPEREKSSASVL